MKSIRTDLSADYVRSVLNYDPETGLFTWKSGVNRRLAAGAIAGTQHGSGYISIQINGHIYLAHRLAWLYVFGRWPSGFLDHINGDRGDTRIANLREASRVENNRNKRTPSHNTSGFKGVHVASNGRVQAHIGVGRRQLYLGSFGSIEEARAAYEAAAQRYFGSFHRQIAGSHRSDALAQAEAQVVEARKTLRLAVR